MLTPQSRCEAKLSAVLLLDTHTSVVAPALFALTGAGEYHAILVCLSSCSHRLPTRGVPPLMVVVIRTHPPVSRKENWGLLLLAFVLRQHICPSFFGSQLCCTP
jgi:hypothetical protein